MEKKMDKEKITILEGEPEHLEVSEISNNVETVREEEEMSEESGENLEKEGKVKIGDETGEEETKSDDLEEVKKKLEEKEKEAAENYDRLLRVAAEFENHKKRVVREKDEYLKYSNEQLIKDLLPVVDNFERAITSGEETGSIEALLEGVKLTFKQFYTLLEKRGLSYIEAVGKVFDPNFHEAVMTIESDDHDDNVVVEELQKGYMLNDRVIRPSMVKVSKS